MADKTRNRLDEAVLAGTELIFAVTDDLALGILAALRARAGFPCRATSRWRGSTTSRR